MKRIKLSDVARKAGLSVASASLILNDAWQGRVSEESAMRTLEIAKELNYRPNAAAKSLRTQSTSSYGFYSIGISVSRYGLEMVNGAILKAEELAHAILISEAQPRRRQSTPIENASSTDSKSHIALDALKDRQIDGLIVAEAIARSAPELEVAKRLPTVFLNCKGPDDSHSILPREYEAGVAITQELLRDQRLKSVVILGSDPGLETKPELSVTVGERLRGIRETLATKTLEVTEIQFSDWEAESGYSHFKEYPLKPDGVICLNDRVAFGVYQRCAELGWVIGKDISVVSFDDDELAQMLRPGLTTARLPYFEMGIEAVTALNEGRSPGVTYVPMPVITRESVANLELQKP